ncbi:MAG: 4Fe-4S binding protein [Acetobacteraceae bacterium]|nr:4Fe-4S binding protein [Acetobacteraceae bacterium]
MRTAGRMLPETLRHVAKKPATVLYPFERLELPPGFRGRPVLDTEKCSGCKICERDCPAGAIEVVTLAPKVLRPGFYYDRCAFCGQCAESCPRDAIAMTAECSLYCTSRIRTVERCDGDQARVPRSHLRTSSDGVVSAGLASRRAATGRSHRHRTPSGNGCASKS